MASLEEQFAKSKKLEEYSRQLVVERRALNEAINVFLSQLEEDIQATRVFLQKFKEFTEDYKKTTKKFMAELDNLKSLRELKEMNRQLFEKLME